MELASLRRWLDEYGRVWECGDADASVRLYTEDIHYYETPFTEPDVGHEAVRAYCLEAAGTQKNVRFSYEPLAVTGDTGIARWHASFVRVPSGVEVELDGVFVLRFQEDGRCRELREWWHRTETDASRA